MGEFMSRATVWFAAGAAALIVAGGASAARAAADIPVNTHFEFIRTITSATPDAAGTVCLSVGTQLVGVEAFPKKDKPGYLLHYVIPVPPPASAGPQSLPFDWKNWKKKKYHHTQGNGPQTTAAAAHPTGSMECAVTGDGTFPDAASGDVSLTCSLGSVDTGGVLQTLGPVTFDMTYAFLQLLDESFIVSVSYSDPIDNCSYTATDVGYQNK
jgi:hypothetical protein